MNINSAYTSPEMEYLTTFLKLVVEMPCGVFRTIKGKCRDYFQSTFPPVYNDIEHTFVAVRHGQGKFIYAMNYNSSSYCMGFNNQNLSVVAIVANGTVYIVDETGFWIGIGFEKNPEILDALASSSDVHIRFFKDYVMETRQAIAKNLADAYDLLSAEDVLTEEDKNNIDANLRRYTVAEPGSAELQHMLAFDFDVPDVMTITSILCGNQEQATVEAMILSKQREDMINHKAVREYTKAQMEKAFQHPDRVLRIAMGLNKAPLTAKNIYVTFSVNDAEETLKLPVWRLRKLLRGDEPSLCYWYFDNRKKAKAAMERFGVDDLYPCDIDKLEFNGKILYANDED